MAITNSSYETSFSCLKIIKNYLRSTMSEKRLNDLAVLSIESDTLEAISFDYHLWLCWKKNVDGNIFMYLDDVININI